MYVLPDKFTYLATPRCGSRSVVSAIKRSGGYRHGGQFRNHHVGIVEIEDLKDIGLPVVTTIRNPYSLVAGLFLRAVHEKSMWRRKGDQFKSWLNWWNPDLHSRGFGDRLFAYEPWVDHHYLLDRGMASVLTSLGILNGVVPWKGHNQYSTDTIQLPLNYKELIDRRFPEDIRLYNEVAATEHHLIH